MGQDELPRDYSGIPKQYTQRFGMHSGRYEDQFGFDDSGFDVHGRNKFGETKKEVIKKRTGKYKRPKPSDLEQTVEEEAKKKKEDEVDNKELMGFFDDADKVAESQDELLHNSKDGEQRVVSPEVLDAERNYGGPLNHSVIGDGRSSRLEDVNTEEALESEPKREPSDVHNSIIGDDHDPLDDDPMNDSMTNLPPLPQPGEDFNFESEVDLTAYPGSSEGIEGLEDIGFSEETSPGGDAYVMDNNPHITGPQAVLSGDDHGQSLEQVHIPGTPSQPAITIDKDEIFDSKRYDKKQLKKQRGPDSTRTVEISASSDKLSTPPGHEQPEGEPTFITNEYHNESARLSERDRIGSYILDEEKKSGGMGVVWSANHYFTDKQVALKIIKSTADDKAINKFRTEAKVMEELDHPNIVNLRDSGEANGLHFLVMEFIEGGDVDGRIESEFMKWTTTANYQGEPHKAKQEWMKEVARYDKMHPRELRSWSIREIVRIVRDAGLGVAHGHKKDLVHLDLKPGNIMLKNGKEVKVTDWGLSNLIEKVNQDTQTISGTPSYMAPEQTKQKEIGKKEINGEEVIIYDEINEKTDVYGLGAVLYELTTGSRQFQTEETGKGWAFLSTILYDRLVPPEQVNPELSLDLCAIIKKAMKKNKEDRYKTMNDMVEDLDNYLAGRPVNARTYSGMQRAGHHLKRNLLRYAGGMAAITMVWLGHGAWERWTELDNLRADTIALYETTDEQFRSRDSKDEKSLIDIQTQTNETLKKIEVLLERDKGNEEALEAKEDLVSNLERIDYEQKSMQLVSFELFYAQTSRWTRKIGNNFSTPEKEYANQLSQVNERIGQLRQVREQSKNNKELTTTIDGIITDCEGLTAKITDLKSQRAQHHLRRKQEEQRQKLQREQEKQRHQLQLAATQSYMGSLEGFAQTQTAYANIPEWFDNQDQAKLGLQEFETALPNLVSKLQQTKSNIEAWMQVDEDNSDAITQLAKVTQLLAQANQLSAQTEQRKQAYQELEEYDGELAVKDLGAARDSIAAAIQLYFEQSMEEPNNQIKSRYDEIIRKQSDWSNYQLDIVAQQLGNHIFGNLHRYDKEIKDEDQRLKEFKEALGLQRFSEQLRQRLLNPGQRQYLDNNDEQSRQYSSSDYSAFKHLGIDEQSPSFHSIMTRFNTRAEQEIIGTIRAAVDSTHFTQAVELNRRVSDRAPLFGGLKQIWLSNKRGGLSIDQFSQYSQMIRSDEVLPTKVRRRIDFWNVYLLKQEGEITSNDYDNLKGSYEKGEEISDELRDKINLYYANLEE